MKRARSIALGTLVVLPVALAGAFWAGTEPADRRVLVGSTFEAETRGHLLEAVRSTRVQPTEGRFQVGFATANITPPSGTPTLGYGARMAQGATESSDPLRAAAFALRTGAGAPVVLLTADLCFWPRELSRPLAARLSDLLTREQLLLGATHTHNGPGAIVDAPAFAPMFGAYSEAVANRILDGAERAARAAVAALAPGGFRVHEIPLPEFVLNRTPSGRPVSDLAVVLELEQAAGPRAVVATYPAHATAIAESHVVSSADYPGALVRSLEASGFEVAGFFAAETGQAAPALDGLIASQDGTRQAERLGSHMAREIAHRLRTSNAKYATTGRLAALRARVALPDWIYRIAGTDRVTNGSLTAWLLGGRQPDAHVHAVVLDRLLLIGHGFEQSAELGKRLREAARERGTVLVPLSFNGEHHFYVVPEASYDGEGYEPTMAFFGPHLGTYLDVVSLQVESLLGSGLGAVDPSEDRPIRPQQVPSAGGADARRGER